MSFHPGAEKGAISHAGPGMGYWQLSSPIILKLVGIIYDAPTVYLEVVYAAPSVYQALSFKYALTGFRHALTGSSQVRDCELNCLVQRRQCCGGGRTQRLVTQLGVGASGRLPGGDMRTAC